MAIEFGNNVSEGHYNIISDKNPLQDGENNIAELHFSVRYYGNGEIFHSDAGLKINEYRKDWGMKVPKINHQFKEGIYQYSEIMPESSLMNYFNAPEGMSLYKPISFAKVEQVRKAYHDARINKEFGKAHMELGPESGRLQSEFRKDLELIDPIKVICHDFKVEEPVAEELRNSDNSLVKTLINEKYL